MPRRRHSRSGLACSEPKGGSVLGSIALLALLFVGVVAASYPRLALAAVVGGVGAHLTRRGVDALRRRRGENRLGGLSAPVGMGSGQSARGDQTAPGRSVPGRKQ
jgi:hypothetical protein